MPEKTPDQTAPKARKDKTGAVKEKSARQVARNYFEGKLGEYEDRCTAYEDELLRQRAEFENYRKRTGRERIESAGRASASLIKRLIPIIDDFDRAIAAALLDEAAGKYAEGLVMIRARFMKALEDEGVTEIESQGLPFDPNIHEAVMQEPSDKYDDEHVIEELRKGYMLGDMVLRPAMVKISRNS